jgi:hypothetical protein
MGYLINYKVKRNYLLTNEENKSIDKCIKYYFGNNNNYFCRYNTNESGIIFSGMAGLPEVKNVIFDETEIESLLFYINCLKCLIEIKKIINNAEWNIYDDNNQELIWDDIMKIVNNQ